MPKTHKSHNVALGMIDIFIFVHHHLFPLLLVIEPQFSSREPLFLYSQFCEIQVFVSPGSRNGHVTQSQPIRGSYPLSSVIGPGSVSNTIGPIRANKTQFWDFSWNCK